MKKIHWQRGVGGLSLIGCFFLSCPQALFLGLILATILGNPYRLRSFHWARQLLMLSIILMGAGVNLSTVATTGLAGLLSTFQGLVVTLAIGMGLTWLFKVERRTGLLISVGTAICGGSAIAAAAPAIDATDEEISASLATVFTLNALALGIFPFIGHRLHLSQLEFGTWCALAIHDTSSVVGAAMQFGPDATILATTLKLTRALWIIPVTFGLSLFSAKGARIKAQPLVMMIGFLAMTFLFSYGVLPSEWGAALSATGRRLLTFCLFLIGVSVDPVSFRRLGRRPFVLGIVLWVVVALTSLMMIHH